MSDVARRLREYFEAHPDGIAAVYLYGSEARGEARPNSDVDVGVLFAAPPPETLEAPRFRIAAELEARLRRPVDLVALNRASPDLVHRVLRDKGIVFEADRSARIRFEVAKRNESFDLLPILRRYRRLAP